MELQPDGPAHVAHGGDRVDAAAHQTREALRVAPVAGGREVVEPLALQRADLGGVVAMVGARDAEEHRAVAAVAVRQDEVPELFRLRDAHVEDPVAVVHRHQPLVAAAADALQASLVGRHRAQVGEHRAFRPITPLDLRELDLPARHVGDAKGAVLDGLAGVMGVRGVVKRIVAQDDPARVVVQADHDRARPHRPELGHSQGELVRAVELRVERDRPRPGLLTHDQHRSRQALVLVRALPRRGPPEPLARHGRKHRTRRAARQIEEGPLQGHGAHLPETKSRSCTLTARGVPGGLGRCGS